MKRTPWKSTSNYHFTLNGWDPGGKNGKFIALKSPSFHKLEELCGAAQILSWHPENASIDRVFLSEIVDGFSYLNLTSSGWTDFDYIQKVLELVSKVSTSFLIFLNHTTGTPTVWQVWEHGSCVRSFIETDLGYMDKRDWPNVIGKLENPRHAPAGLYLFGNDRGDDPEVSDGLLNPKSIMVHHWSLGIDPKKANRMESGDQRAIGYSFPLPKQ